MARVRRQAQPRWRSRTTAWAARRRLRSRLRRRPSTPRRALAPVLRAHAPRAPPTFPRSHRHRRPRPSSAGRSLRRPMIEVRREIRPVWPFRLPGAGGMDGVARRRGGVLERLLHVEDEPVVRARRAAGGRSRRDRRAGARGADVVRGGDRADALRVRRRRRRCAPFYERFRDDPLIGPLGARAAAPARARAGRSRSRRWPGRSASS